jgi:hypothetical protein
MSVLLIAFLCNQQQLLLLLQPPPPPPPPPPLAMDVGERAKRAVRAADADDKQVLFRDRRRTLFVLNRLFFFSVFRSIRFVAADIGANGRAHKGVVGQSVSIRPIEIQFKDSN